MSNAIAYQGINHATLTNKEERALVVALSAARSSGDRAAFLKVRDRLLLANIRLVWSVAKRYVGRGLAADDLLAYGVAGALYGLENFDAAFGVRLATYLIPAIRSGVGRAVANLGRTVRLPDGMQRFAARALRIAREHHTRFGAEPEVDELAAAAGCTVRRLSSALASPAEPLSFETPTGDEDAGGTLADTIASEDESPLDALDRHEREALAWRLLSGLDSRSRAIVVARANGDTHEQAAAPWGISRQRAQQLEALAICTLRERVQEEELAGAGDDADDVDEDVSAAAE